MLSPCPECSVFLQSVWVISSLVGLPISHGSYSQQSPFSTSVEKCYWVVFLDQTIVLESWDWTNAGVSPAIKGQAVGTGKGVLQLFNYVVCYQPFLFLVSITCKLNFQRSFQKNMSLWGELFIFLHEIVGSSALLDFPIHSVLNCLITPWNSSVIYLLEHLHCQGFSGPIFIFVLLI